MKAGFFTVYGQELLNSVPKYTKKIGAQKKLATGKNPISLRFLAATLILQAL